MGKVVDKSATEVSGVARGRGGGGGGGGGKCKCITDVDGEGQVFCSPELAQVELLGYRYVRRTCGRPSSVHQLFSLCTL